MIAEIFEDKTVDLLGKNIKPATPALIPYRSNNILLVCEFG